jgi:integrase
MEGPMGLYKRGRTYWIDYYANGKRHREPVGNREEARVVLGERLQGIRQGKHPELMKLSPTLFADHVVEVKAKHYAHKRCRQWAELVIDVHLKPFFGTRVLTEITPRLIGDYISARRTKGVGAATVNNERAVLSKILSLAVEWDRLPRNPVSKVPKLELAAVDRSRGIVNGRRMRYLSVEEAKKLIEKAPDHIKPVLVTCLETGGRISEVLSLTFDDLDFGRGVLYFNQTNTKSGRQREIPMTPLLVETLRERAKVRRIDDRRGYVFTRFGERIRDIRTAFSTARDRAGLGPDVTVHVLRHSAAALYISRPGSDLHMLRDLLGHQDLRTTMVYAHLAPEYRKAAVPLMGIGGAPANGHKSDTGSRSAAG